MLLRGFGTPIFPDTESKTIQPPPARPKISLELLGGSALNFSGPQRDNLIQNVAGTHYGTYTMATGSDNEKLWNLAAHQMIKKPELREGRSLINMEFYQRPWLGFGIGLSYAEGQMQNFRGGFALSYGGRTTLLAYSGANQDSLITLYRQLESLDPFATSTVRTYQISSLMFHTTIHANRTGFVDPYGRIYLGGGAGNGIDSPVHEGMLALGIKLSHLRYSLSLEAIHSYRWMKLDGKNLPGGNREHLRLEENMLLFGVGYRFQND